MSDVIKIKADKKTRQVLIEGHGIRMTENSIRKSFYEIGKLIKKETQKGIKNPPKTGRYYKHKGRRIRASINIANKEYPANRSGKLRRSINFKVQDAKKLTIGLSAEYAKFLEEGTVYMEKRKLLDFTIKIQRNKIRDVLRKNMDEELKR